MTETPRATPEDLPWEPLTPQQVAERMRGAGIPWFIAGGWALDLFIGRQTRAHEDIEIAVFRADVEALRAHLSAMELFMAESGTLSPWRTGPLPKPAHAIWARDRGRTSWQLEVLVEERSGDRWRYRRDPDVGLHVRDLGRLTEEGLPYVRPDVQLLYKSKHPRPSDETDLLTVLPRLDAAQRSFLAAALWTTAPAHRWLERLK